MFSWLLMSSGNNKPDAIIGPKIENIEMWGGIFIGVIVTVFIFMIIKVIKLFIENEKDDNEKSDEESDE